MSNIGLLPWRFDVRYLWSQLQEPALWNLIPHRTEHPESPHREVDDIWVRYNPYENYRGDMAAFNGPHKAEWYPVADMIPAVYPLVNALHAQLPGALGAVLITRIRAGCQVYPHADSGWHAETHEKFVIQIAGNLGQSFCYENESLSVEAGDSYWFNNGVKHWVVNPTIDDRISLIVCIRRDKCH